jgi:hypothetical protein
VGEVDAGQDTPGERAMWGVLRYVQRPEAEDPDLADPDVEDPEVNGPDVMDPDLADRTRRIRA